MCMKKPHKSGSTNMPDLKPIVWFRSFCNCMLACNAIPQQQLNGLTWEYNKENMVPLQPHPSWWALRSLHPSTFNLVWSGLLSSTRTGWGEMSTVSNDLTAHAVVKLAETPEQPMLFQLLVSPHVLSDVIHDCLHVCQWEQNHHTTCSVSLSSVVN